jgi:hypothetical protein
MMRKLVSLGVSLTVLPLMAGCSIVDLARLAGVSLPRDVDGDGVISSAEAALAGYSKSYAQAGSTLTVTEAQKGSGGLAGYGVTSVVPGNTRTDATTTFTTASIQMAADNSSLTVSANGTTYTLPQTASPGTIQVNGKDYTVYGFGFQPHEPLEDYGPANVGATLSGQYSSLAFFFKNANWSQGTGLTYDGYTLIATGLETPDSGLPTQIVEYGGNWYLIVGDQTTSGTFTAEANFETDALSVVAYSWAGNEAGTGSATINGNQFAGTVSGPETSLNGDMIGAFYGPNAEEIAGTAQGTLTVDGSVQDGAAFYIGNQSE